MKKYNLIFLLSFLSLTAVQAQESDKKNTYKKRVLESTEVDFLTSYYTQTGNNAAVTGGIGTEKLSDITPTIVVSMPINADDVLTIDVGISAYTSASSSNLDPFDASGASSNEEDDDNPETNTSIKGSPWVASSGASKQDLWFSLSANYSHSSDDRNTVTSGHISFASEYDYISFGIGGAYTKLFNEKNTELGISAQVYFDSWLPKYPTELDSYLESGSNSNRGFFYNVPIYNQSGNATDKTGNAVNNWSPASFNLIDNKSRNSYATSLSFSQILSKNAQFSIFLDVIQQNGWLANPMQRVYFKDVDNYYIGNKNSIPNYQLKSNTDVFQLADDIERLPDSRLKTPIGARLNYYINEIFALRTYYRYYTDNWGLNSHTANVEIPIKISSKYTVYPSYRYYTQNAADYFAPYEQHISTQSFYTSDYDLSKFNATQYGIGISYTDIFAEKHIWKFGMKSIDFKFNQYTRNTGLSASIVTLGFKFVMD